MPIPRINRSIIRHQFSAFLLALPLPHVQISVASNSTTMVSWDVVVGGVSQTQQSDRRIAEAATDNKQMNVAIPLTFRNEKETALTHMWNINYAFSANTSSNAWWWLVGCWMRLMMIVIIIVPFSAHFVSLTASFWSTLFLLHILYLSLTWLAFSICISLLTMLAVLREIQNILCAMKNASNTAEATPSQDVRKSELWQARSHNNGSSGRNRVYLINVIYLIFLLNKIRIK